MGDTPPFRDRTRRPAGPAGGNGPKGGQSDGLEEALTGGLNDYRSSEGQGAGMDFQPRTLNVVPGASDTNSRIDRLRQLMRAAACLQFDGDPDLASLGHELEAWITAGASTPLDVALGLRVRGGISTRRALAIGDRDILLRHLARTCALWRDLPFSLAASQMRDAFERYEMDRWPRERAATVVPSSEPAATFWKILHGGQTVPKLRQLRRTLAVAIQSAV